MDSCAWTHNAVDCNADNVVIDNVKAKISLCQVEYEDVDINKLRGNREEDQEVKMNNNREIDELTKDKRLTRGMCINKLSK